MAIACCSVVFLFEQLSSDFAIVGSRLAGIALVLRYFVLVFYIGSWVYLGCVFYQIYGSLYHLRKKRFLKYTKPFAWFYDKFLHKEFYEKNHRPRVAFADSPFKGLDVACFSKVQSGGTVLLLYDDTTNYINELVRYIENTVDSDETVDFITTFRSPIELCGKFSDRHILKISKRLSIVDCFSVHYRFDDKVVKFAKKDFGQKGFVFYDAASFSEIHTAVNNSWYRFRKVCKNEENSFRIPHRTIYDTLSSLIRFSSEEQYLLFMRHMISSEKTYGMISLVIEPSTLKTELKDDLIRMADIVLLYTSDGFTVSKG